jgi:redox-sensing transcriptional repressor
MEKELPIPSLTRLCAIYELLSRYEKNGRKKISSTELGKSLGVGAVNIRKDINFFGETGNFGVGGYEVCTLKKHIGNALELGKKRNACVVGLGRLGSAMLAYNGFMERGFTLIAGFDSDVNLVDTIKTAVPVYPTYEISDMVRAKKIELGIITVPAQAAKDVARRLIDGGVKGIVNFSPEAVSSDDPEVHVTNIDIIEEFAILSALISRDELKKIKKKM